ncbi:Uncharacterised protein [Klebsiella pneumoniae]|nr:Uncharacterised protein [Klebsiella pneumoniae]
MSTAASVRKIPREIRLTSGQLMRKEPLLIMLRAWSIRIVPISSLNWLTRKLKTSFWINVYLYWITKVMIRLLRNWKLLYRMQKGVNV